MSTSMMTRWIGTLAFVLIGALAQGCDEGKGADGDGGAGGDTSNGGSTGEGAGDTGTTPGTGGTGNTGTSPAPASMIDDMEDGDGSILAVEGRLGAWYTYNDETATGVQVPEVGLPFEMAPLNPPREGSTFAANTNGQGFDTWGSGFGFDFNNNGTSKGPYDASKFSGITFWAKVSAGTTGVIRVNVGDGNTAPEGGVCDNVGGKCNDDFGGGVSVTEDWKQYTLKFSEMSQVGWSMALLPALDTKTLYSVHFQTGAMAKFDIWIDDIAFTE